MNTSTSFDQISTARITRTTALIASLSMAFLAGCGSGGGSHGGSGSSSSSAYSDRTYAAANVPLGANQTGSLTVAVGADAATIAGTLNLILTSVSGETRAAATTNISVPLTGTISSVTGVFTLSGTVTENGVVYAVTVTGTLTAFGTSSVTITINGAAYPATLGSGTTLTGQLSAAYFPITSNSNLVYTETDSDGTGTPTTSTETGNSFIGGFNTTTGATTQTTLNGATVNKTAIMDSTGLISEYEYYTETNSALTLYGEDDVDTDTNTVTDMLRYNPPYVIPFTLSAGQTYTQTVSYADTSVTNSSTSNIFTYTEAITFNDFEMITTPAGTFAAAKFTVTTSNSTPATSTSGGETFVGTDTAFLAPNVGIVQEHDVDVDTIAAFGTTAASTNTSTDDTLLTSTTGAGASTSSETKSKSAAKSVHAGRFAAPGIFGLLRGMRR